MAEYFGDLLVPDRSDMVSWVDPEQIDMSTAETFLPPNRQIVGAVLDHVLAPDATVLEVAAGTGHMGKLIPDTLHGRYVQSDQNPLYVTRSRAYNGLPAVTADIYQPPFVNTRDNVGFDAVVAMDLLDILPELPTAAQKIAGLLRDSGMFVHFHNRMPCMATLAEQFQEDGYVFPAITDEDGLSKFRIVPRDAYEAERDSLDNPVASDIIARRPDLLELFYEDEYDTFAAVAQDIAKRLGDSSFETPSLIDLMHNAATVALAGAGMSVLFAEVVPGESFVTHEHLAPLLEQYGLGNEFNLVEKHASKARFGVADDLPEGLAHMTSDLSVLIASKSGRG